MTKTEKLRKQLKDGIRSHSWLVDERIAEITDEILALCKENGLAFADEGAGLPKSLLTSSLSFNIGLHHTRMFKDYPDNFNQVIPQIVESMCQNLQDYRKTEPIEIEKGKENGERTCPDSCGGSRTIKEDCWP